MVFIAIQKVTRKCGITLNRNKILHITEVQFIGEINGRNIKSESGRPRKSRQPMKINLRVPAQQK
jgi:hypothetical protein